MLPLAWIAYVQARESGIRAVLSRAPAALGGIVGVGIYVLYVVSNHLGAFDVAYAHEWQLFMRLPFDAIQDYLARLGQGNTLPFENDNVFAMLCIVGTGILVMIKWKHAYTLYVWSALALILVRYHGGAQFESMFRYALLMFPCFLAAAEALPFGWQIGVYMAAGGQWMWVLLDRFIHWVWVA